MEVFYVVLLVLVAGVVPSHGRTESEGTVFNKTQLHESMSNVTVSSNKVVDYSVSYLALQWPVSFCIDLDANSDRQCNQQAPPRFTVHGLWPQNPEGVPVDCRFRDSPYPRFNYYNLTLGRINLNELNIIWPDLTRMEGDNRNFWVNEYNKHGSCTFNDPILYFSRTVELARHFRYLISWLNRYGIRLGLSYRINVIRNAVRRATHLRPTFQCVSVRNRVYLLEIRFCVSPNRRGGNGLIDCDLITTNCRGSVFIPSSRYLRF